MQESYLQMKLLAKGYTLVELLMVMAIIGAVGLIAYYAIGSSNDRQAVANAQLEFVSNLRSVINAVNNGAGGMNNRYIWIDTESGDDHYDMKGNDGGLIQQIFLPAGVRINLVGEPPQTYVYASVCAANPNMESYTDTIGVSYCPPCSNPASYFACAGTDLNDPNQSVYFGKDGQATLKVRFSSTRNPLTVFKEVLIEGSGTTISRVTPL